ncbi:two-component sensor histidine kinase [Tabrizicola sp. TH137]|uniref:sensor histidine kinase n=1 Tax=Tabrizicola sp. TH137 TaxID=2067452 RepID=UPI000C7DDBBE|nr:ATP-binding protein [Tabrizicola sp. TH137]PLL10731.1 two-component sensor histidine kinase [Tabrizicola sp. TH137]
MARRRQGRIVMLLAALCLLVTLAVDRLATRAALREGQARAEVTLRQTVNALEGHIRRFEALPALLARDDEVRDFFAVPQTAAGIDSMNLWLKATNDLAGSSDLYLIAPDGVTLAASNFDRPDSFVGESFTYRPYFTDALAGGTGRFFALGTTSGVRGYYFGSPVRDGSGRVIGVVALKIGVDDLEAAWRSAEYEILVSDPEGIVFMATDPTWRYRGLLPLTAERVARTEASRRYAEIALAELAVQRASEGRFALLSLSSGGVARDYLEVERAMPEAGWTVHVWLDTAPLRGQARLTVAATVLLLGVALSLGWALWQRRARLAERIALQAAAQADLERQVAERTADLTRANEELHRMQADLVQAGKLAALGRMSAALSHEINQPLAAARNWADSAALLIERGEVARARENIGQILSLIDRMAAIARHLRNVARKPEEPLKVFPLAPVVADALQVAETRLKASGHAVQVDLAPDLPLVRGGPVRLQQVIVNLLSNAADAMEGRAGEIELGARAEGGEVVMTVRDHGPGVAAAIADRIFDPFFTTKTVGSGLGLGLSISYNIMKDFGGDLRVANHPEGGAVFSVVLMAAGRAEGGMAAE